LDHITKTAESVIRSWELFVLYCFQFGLILWRSEEKELWVRFKLNRLILFPGKQWGRLTIGNMLKTMA